MRWPVVMLIALALVGCRKSEDETTVTTSDGTVTVSGNKVTFRTEDGKGVIETTPDGARIRTGDGSMVIGGKTVPEGFPLPVMEGAAVEYSSHITPANDPEVYQVGLQAAGDPDEMARFYSQALENKGLDVSRSDSSNDGTTMMLLTGKSENVETTIMIVKESDSEKATVTITWTNQPG